MNEHLSVDLTALKPAALLEGRPLEEIWPSFCLPWFSGEDPLVGEAARLHRRSTDPNAWEDEALLDLEQRGRYHFAEGWLAMAREPDSIQPANVRFEWTPPGEKDRVVVSFQDVVRSVLRPLEGPTRDLALIVPDGLGPGPRQELLDRIESGFRSVYLVPRSVAGALAWCRSGEARRIADRVVPLPGSHRVGTLLVTVAAADTWEAAVVPIRHESDPSRFGLRPIHERVHHRSEIGIAGLERSLQIEASAAGVTPADVCAAWLRVAVCADPRVQSRQGIEAVSDAFFHWCHPGRVAPGWRPTNASQEVERVLREQKRQSRILGWVHVTSRPAEGIEPAFVPFQDICGLRPQVLAPQDLLESGIRVLSSIQQGQPPYFEALAQVDLYVLSRNEFQDPEETWRPLIEATEVPVGQRYQSPRPIEDLSLPRGEVRVVDFYVRRIRRGNSETGVLRVTQTRPQESSQPVRIHATLQPGQGMARFEVDSVPRGLFHASVAEAELRPVEHTPPLTYAWPPGAAWVVADASEAAKARRSLELLYSALRSGRNLADTLRRATKAINQWRPYSRRHSTAPLLCLPSGVHPLFVYRGVVPCGNAPADPAVEPLIRDIIGALPRVFLQSGCPQLRDSALYFSSWFYSRCPDVVLEYVRSHIYRAVETNAPILACAGNCFTEKDDHRAFFRHLECCHRNRRLDGIGWIRALRNLARFRIECFERDVVSEGVMDVLVDTYLRKFRTALPSGGNSAFNHCCQLSPHILKRRRFDPAFLSLGSRQAELFADILWWASRRAPSLHSRASVQCALEFLNRVADGITLERLSRADSF